jgi:hypothetical protein
MFELKYLALALAIGSGFSPLRVACQSLAQPPNMMEKLNKEAEATDPAGIHAYCKHLIGLFPAVRGGGAAYADALTDRLARAELMARLGKRKLISEIEVAEAFNDLMRRTGAPAPMKADLAAVESARSGWEKQLPALISREKNGIYCYPGESFFILEILIENVGRPRTPTPDNAPKMHVDTGYAPVQLHLDMFSERHSISENKTVLNHLFNALQI